MRALLLAACSLLVSAGIVAGENPFGFPMTTRTLVAEFASADEARAAELSVAPLYGNAPLAFSVRWDDTNARHPKKAEMMNRAGVKGTFYLVNWLHDHPAFIAEELKRRGHDVGNHTLGHPHLPQVSPNRVFREVVLNRMVVETNSQQTVTAYVAPFGWGDPKKAPAGHIALIRRIVSESGHFVTCDRSWPALPEGASDFPVYPARWFMSDDRNPKADLFRREFSNAVTEVSAAGQPGRVAFSMHAWCDDAGDAVQEGCLKEVRAAHPEYWYVADNDYGAYCYQRDNVRFRKLKTNGARVIWEVVGFSAAQLGADVPLTLRFMKAPKSVCCGGAVLVSTNGVWNLPPVGKRMVRIGCVGADGTHAAFPGLVVRLSLDSDGQVATVEIANGGKTALEGGWAVLFASPERPDAGRVVLPFGTLGPGERFTRRIDLGRLDADALREGERPLVVLSCDFEMASVSCRLWQMKEGIE